MDSALSLRLDFERNEIKENTIEKKLNDSLLVSKLTTDFLRHPLFACFRIMGISEIPFSQTLDYTKNLIKYINKEIVTEEEFSCLGGVQEVVPCYNAMLLEAYSRLGLAQTKEAQAALYWIIQYQLFERNQTTSWSYDGICKHGWCLGKIPCYIGIGKTVRALITYAEFSEKDDPTIKELIQKGIDYMLEHHMYGRLSTGKPISAHITDIMMPQNYALSFTDLVYIVGKRKLQQSEKVKPLLSLLEEKSVSQNEWKIDYIYKYKGYIPFETRRKPSEWISSLFPIWLGN